MNLALQQKLTRRKRGILYGVLLLAVMLSLPTGMVVAAVGAWFAVQGGSLMYLPLGLVILLAVIAIARSHSVVLVASATLASLALAATY